jgi:hypothetical protein
MPAARWKFRERADSGDDKAKEHDLFHVLFPAIGNRATLERNRGERSSGSWRSGGKLQIG